MSGIKTGAKLAILNTHSGMDLDTYKDWQELTLSALYQHAIGCHERSAVNPAVSAGGKSTDAQLCDALLARLDAITATVREQVIDGYDPARRRLPEVWPFCVADSAAKLMPELYYGFSDSGGLVCGGTGYSTEGGLKSYVGREQEVAANELGHYFSSDPEELGGVACCVLTGRQYVDRLYYLCEHDAHENSLEPYGKWSAAGFPPDTEHVKYPRGKYEVMVPLFADGEGAKPSAIRAAIEAALQEFTGTTLKPFPPSTLAMINKAEVK